MSLAPLLCRLVARHRTARPCAAVAIAVATPFAVAPGLAAAAPPVTAQAPVPAPSQAAPTLLGRVVDSHGKPAAGIRVYLISPGQPADHLILAQGDSDAGGAFRTVVRPEWQHRLLYLAAFAPGFAPVFHLVAPGGLPNGGPTVPAPTLSLDPVRLVHFRLVGADDKPVDGVNVVLNQREAVAARGEAPPNGYWVPPMDFAALSDAVHLPWFAAVVRTQSVSGGWVRVAVGSAGDLLTLGVQKSGYVPMPVRLCVPTEDGLTVRLSPGAVVRGRVVRQQGAAGGGVQTVPAGGTVVGWQANGAQVATDKDGRFVFTDLDAGPDYLLLKPSSGGPDATSDAVLPPTWVAPVPGQTVDLGDLVAETGGRLTVTLAGDPSDGAFSQRQYFVSATLLTSSTDAEDAAAGAATADPARAPWTVVLQPQWDGVKISERYAFRLPAGIYRIATHNYDGGAPAGRIDVTVEDGRDRTITLALPAPGTRPNAAAAAPPDSQTPQQGTIIDSATGQPLSGAAVSAYTSNGVLGTTRSGADGRYSLPAPSASRLGGSEPRYVLVAAAAGYAPVLRQMVLSAHETDVDLRLPPASSSALPLVVTDSAGNAVAGATVAPWRIPVPFGGRDQWPRQIDLAPSVLDVDNGAAAVPASGGLSAVADAAGRATLVGLPASGFITLKVDGPGYASTYATVALPHAATLAHVTLSRPAVLTGQLRLANGTPLDGRYFTLQATADNYPDTDGGVTFDATIDASGTYNIGGIPSLAVLGAPTLSLTAQLADNSGAAAGVLTSMRASAFKVQQLSPNTGDGDLVATVGDQRYIAYSETGTLGLTYTEGAVVHHDIVFYPAALLRGVLDRTLPPGVPVPQGSKPWGRVYYTDPHSAMYQTEARCDEDGRFEITVPVGVPLALNWEIGVQHNDGGWQTMITGTASVPPLHAQEVREDFEPRFVTDARTENWQIPGGPQGQQHIVRIRVIGPDGATVPRPRLTWLLRNAGPAWSAATGATVSRQMGRQGVASGLDGTVEINIWGGGGVGSDASGPLQVEVASPDLTAPVTLPFSWASVDRTGAPLRVRLDRIPTLTPPPPPNIPFGDNGNTEGAPAMPDRAAIGQPAPDLQVRLWYAGQPVRLSDLRGKLVVLMFDRVWTRASFARFFHRYGHDPRLAVIGLEQGDWMTQDDFGPGAEERTQDLLAIAQDPQMRDTWLTYNSARFGSGQDGVAVIGPDGAVLAEQIGEPFLSAMADSILTP